MPLRDDLLTPIPGANPSGADLRYDPVLDKIREARREELEAPQGAWKTAIKVADYGLVIKLAGEVLATRSKNVQIAAWLVDAHVRREGFGALASCFRFLRSLCQEFWSTLYPEIEDGDLEMRAAPLDWLGSKLDEPIRLVPITANGFTWFRYKESRVVGTEAEANTNDKRKARQQAITDGKLTAEEFDAAVDETPKQFCETQLAAIEEAQAALEELISFLDENFRDVSPSFTKVRTALEDNAHLLKGFISRKGGQTVVPSAPPERTAPEPVAPPPSAPVVRIPEVPAPAIATQPAAPATQAPTAQPSPASLSAEPLDFEDAVKRVAGVARFLRAKDAYDIAPYLILRGLRWGEIRYNGSDIDRSMLTAPDDQLRKDLAHNLAAGQWDKVLALTEQTMETSCGRGWLDLQRYTVKALEGKGQWFASVAQAVRSGVRGLVTDLPALLDMSLRDGSPAADSETHGWIEREILSGAPLSLQPAAAPAPVREPESEPVVIPEPPPAPVLILARPPQIEGEDLSDGAPSDVFDEALSAAKAGNVAQALSILNHQLASERSGRNRFKRRVQIAHLLIATGHPQIAQPVLDEVAREIDSRKLEDWEDGNALAYPLSLLLQCANGDPQRKRDLYAAVCRLDPVRALQLTA